MCKWGSAFCFAVCLALAFTTRADVASEAGFFDAIARRAYQKGAYEEALESFQLVQEIAPSHRTLYNIALCADLAGRSEMAFTQYAQYLGGDDPDAARRAEAERRLVNLTRELALLDIETEPAGAVVYLDRKELGSLGVTPTTIAVPAGDHRVLLERAGYAPHELTVVHERGTHTTQRSVLEPWLGAVVVRVTPANAELQFSRGGVVVPTQPEGGRYRLAVGQYQLVAAARGYVSSEVTLLVHKDDDVRLDVALVPLPRATGRLLVSTGEVAADVFIDGQRMAVTPATLSGLGAGPHVLEVKAGKREARRDVVISAGHSIYIAIDLGEAAQ